MSLQKDSAFDATVISIKKFDFTSSTWNYVAMTLIEKRKAISPEKLPDDDRIYEAVCGAKRKSVMI